MTHLALAITALLPAAAHALLPDDVLLYASFDSRPDADVARGARKAEPQGGEPTLVPGVVGRGVRVGAENGWLRYAGTGNLRPNRGTVAFWVQPVDWSGDDDRFRVWFSTPGMIVYKYGDRNAALSFYRAPTPRRVSWIHQPIPKWEPGEWHHLAATWGAEGLAFYADGELVGRTVGLDPLTDPPTDFCIGPKDGWGGEKHSVVDEFLLFRRALTADEVRAVMRRDRPPWAAWPLDTVPPVALTLDWLPFERVLAARVALPTAGLDDGSRVHVSLRRPAERQPLVESTVPSVEEEAVARLDLRAVAPGGYEVAAEWLRGGKVVATGSRPFHRERTPTWSEAKALGRSDQVLPPWQPVRLKAAELACWNRVYRLKPDGFPAQIESAGEPLLAAPVALHVRANGAELAWQTQPWKGTVGAATVTGSASQRSGALALRCAARLEYDGFLLYEVRLAASAPARLDAAWLDVPLHAAHARLANSRVYPLPGQTFPALHGRTPEKQGCVWQSPFQPYLWLGDYDRGLAWAAESDGAWQPATPETALELHRAGETVTLRLNLLGSPTTLTGARTFRFALQATPVRPMPDGWRRLALRGSSGYPPPNIVSLWNSEWCGPTTPSHSYPRPRDEREFAERVKDWHAKGFRVAPYVSLTDLASNSPEAREYDAAWAPTEQPLSQGEQAGEKIETRTRQVCPGSGWADFLVWSLSDLIARYGLDGVYLDNNQPAWCRDPRHGHADLADSPERPVQPIFANRDLFRRLRQVYTAAGRPSAIWTSSKPLACWAFGDVYCHGEGINFGAAKSLEEQRRNVDWLMADLNGKQLGLVGFLLPGIYQQEVYLAPGYTEALLSICLLCDLPLWSIWCDPAVVQRTYQAAWEWGYQDAEFLGYWQLAGRVKCEAPGVETSLYRRHGRALLVVSNLDVTDFEGAVRADWPGLELPAAPKCVDAVTSEPIALANGALPLKIPAKSFRLVAAGP